MIKQFSALTILSSTLLLANIIELKLGWNLISLPVDTTISYSELSTKLPNANTVWKYNNGWKAYGKGDIQNTLNTANISNIDTISKREGFWVNNSASEVLELTGENYDIVNSGTLSTLNSGWHLLGTGTDTTVSNIINENNDIDTIWIYDGKWEAYGVGDMADTLSDVGIVQLTNVEQGQGFWVNVKDPALSTIIFNGKEYGMLISPTTGKIWLDRNIGANSICQSVIDSECIGDYFQWGRNVDGHEKVNSALTYNLENSIENSSNQYVSLDYGSWLNTDSTGFHRAANWSKVDGTSVCPSGFRVASLEEFKNENIVNSEDAYNKLKLPSNTGWRAGDDGIVYYTDVPNPRSFYWTNTLEYNPYSKTSNKYYYYGYSKNETDSYFALDLNGLQVRCIMSNDNIIFNKSEYNISLSETIDLEISGSILKYSLEDNSSNDNDNFIMHNAYGYLSVNSKYANFDPVQSTYKLGIYAKGLNSSTYETITINILNNTNETIFHNGIVYGTVVSPYTGKVWLDRNLDANRKCIYRTDEECYGGLYQWGSDSSTIFIPPSDDNDWLYSEDKDGSIRQIKWSKTDGSSICPIGFRVPTANELKAETIDVGQTSRYDISQDFLKTPSPGYTEDGTYTYEKDYDIGLWSNSISNGFSQNLYIVSNSAEIIDDKRYIGLSVRCIKD